MVMNLIKMIQKLKTIIFCYCGSGEAFQFGAFINQSTNKQYSLKLTCTEYSGTYALHVRGILPTSQFVCLNHSIRPGNRGRRKHSPKKKFDEIGKEKFISSFLPSKYLSVTYVARYSSHLQHFFKSSRN